MDLKNFRRLRHIRQGDVFKRLLDVTRAIGHGLVSRFQFLKSLCEVF